MTVWWRAAAVFCILAPLVAAGLICDLIRWRSAADLLLALIRRITARTEIWTDGGPLGPR